MSFGQTVSLGALAGLTIYLGLPLGRLATLSDRARVAAVRAKTKGNTLPKISSSTRREIPREKTNPAITAMAVMMSCIPASGCP